MLRAWRMHVVQCTPVRCNMCLQVLSAMWTVPSGALSLLCGASRQQPDCMQGLLQRTPGNTQLTEPADPLLADRSV